LKRQNNIHKFWSIKFCNFLLPKINSSFFQSNILLNTRYEIVHSSRTMTSQLP
jgi:hypothetical protein